MNNMLQSFNKGMLSNGSQVNLNKFQGFKAHWVGMSPVDMEKYDKFAGVYNKRMFHNLLYNSFGRSEVTADFVAQVFRGIRKFDAVSAKAMYGMFYTGPLGMGAATQQHINNVVHRM